MTINFPFPDWTQQSGWFPPYIPPSAITDAFRDVLMSGTKAFVEYGQLCHLIEEHIEKRGGGLIAKPDANDHDQHFRVLKPSGNYDTLFESVSYIACVEWALRQIATEQE